MVLRLHPWRLFLLVMLVSGGAVGILEWGRRSRDSSDAALFLRLPFENEGVQVFVDVQALRQAGLLDMLAGSRAAEETDYRSFVQDTRFDYREHLDTIFGAFLGERAVFVLRGRFDWTAIRRHAVARGAKCVNGYCSLPASKPNRYLSFYSVFPSVLAVGIANDPGSAWGASAQRDPPPGFHFPPQPFWVAVPATVLNDADALPAGTRAFASAVRQAQHVTLGIGSSGANLAVEMQATFASAEDSGRTRDRLEEITRLLRNFIQREKQAPNPRDLSGVLTAGVFEQRENKVLGRWPVRREFLQALAGGNLDGGK